MMTKKNLHFDSRLINMSVSLSYELRNTSVFPLWQWLHHKGENCTSAEKRQWRLWFCAQRGQRWVMDINELFSGLITAAHHDMDRSHLWLWSMISSPDSSGGVQPDSCLPCSAVSGVCGRGGRRVAVRSADGGLPDRGQQSGRLLRCNHVLDN